MTAAESPATPTRTAPPGGPATTGRPQLPHALPSDAIFRAVPPKAQLHHRAAAHRRPGFLAWLLALASLLSLAALVWVLCWPPAQPWHDRVVGVDVAISALFALQWLWRLARTRGDRAFWGTAWWELVAIVPLITPWAGDHTFPLVVVGLARLARAIDTCDDLYGDFITIWLVHHFSAPIVEAIKRPITVAVLDEVIDVIKTGTYAANVRSALDENHAELESMVLELLREDQTTGKLKYLPFHDDIVKLVADTVLRIVDGALDDPRTTELISDVIRNSATQLRQAIRDEV
ncbi:ion transporter [Nocardioides sp. DS6]|uniref:Ion transporter n=1 Tax=Nocardioides eburneus TaxID=3231482 RepID=A0ABV3SZR7_9ACTN